MPYTQPAAVRWAVEVSITAVWGFSISATASTAAASGRHRNAMSAAFRASRRAPVSFRTAPPKRDQLDIPARRKPLPDPQPRGARAAVNKYLRHSHVLYSEICVYYTLIYPIFQVKFACLYIKNPVYVITAGARGPHATNCRIIIPKSNRRQTDAGYQAELDQSQGAFSQAPDHIRRGDRGAACDELSMAGDHARVCRRRRGC